MDNKPLARIPAPVWAALFLVIYLALAIHSEYWLGIVTTHPIGDDFKIYYGAYLKAKVGENPYEPYGIGSGFIYHPAALTFVSLFVWPGNQWISTYLWIAASAIAWGISIWLAVRLARSAWVNECGAATAHSRVHTWFIVSVFLGFAPFWETLHIGQINAFVALCLLLALYFAHIKRYNLAGIVLALAVVLKTFPPILLAYFAVMRKFRLAAVALAGLAIFSSIAALQFSPQIFIRFWDILPRLGAEIHPDTYNQSLLSVLYQSIPAIRQYTRTLILGHRLAFSAIGSALLLSGFILRSRSRPASVWLYAALLTVIVFFSPLVWYHHSTFLLLPLSALLLHPRRTGFLIGLGLMLVLQAERLFEQFVTLTAYPIVAAQALLIAIMCVIWFNRARVRVSKPRSPNPVE